MGTVVPFRRPAAEPPRDAAGVMRDLVDRLAAPVPVEAPRLANGRPLLTAHELDTLFTLADQVPFAFDLLLDRIVVRDHRWLPRHLVLWTPRGWFVAVETNVDGRDAYCAPFKDRGGVATHWHYDIRTLAQRVPTYPSPIRALVSVDDEALWIAHRL